MRKLSLFMGLLALAAAQAAHATTFNFNTTVNSSSANVATLDITQQGTDTLFQLAPGADFASLGSNAHFVSFSFGYTTPARLKSGFNFPGNLPANNVQPSTNFSSKLQKSSQNYVNKWVVDWKNASFGSTQTSAWITKNSEANLFGQTFLLKIQGLTGTRTPLKLTALNAAPVPEVSNFSMYVTGLGLVGLVMLRRRHGSRAAGR